MLHGSILGPNSPSSVRVDVYGVNGCPFGKLNKDRDGPPRQDRQEFTSRDAEQGKQVSIRPPVDSMTTCLSCTG
jgi:hypothetical protein